MIILDRLLIGGLGFVFDKIASAVDAERDDAGSIKEEILALQMQLELGEISDEDFAALERDLLDRLRALRQEDRPAGAVSLDRGGFEVDVTFEGDESPRGHR
ncbi:MAG TPA: gas vesicle protein GvpG [Thermoanaerobaculia bacterium]|nr:gas vesicle protein GvpG [Thermoanaerobaculia bacterium]